MVEPSARYPQICRRRVVSARGLCGDPPAHWRMASFPAASDDWLKSAAHQKKQAAARSFYRCASSSTPSNSESGARRRLRRG